MRNFILLSILFLTVVGYAQEPSFADMERKLKKLAETEAGYTESVQISVSGVALGEFISAVALEHNLNVSVDKDLTEPIANNFYNAIVVDVYIFLIKEHDLVIDISGTILSFHKRKPQIVPPKPYVQKQIKLEYKPENEFLSLDLKRDSLHLVAEAITKASNKNVVLSPSVKEKIVSVYIENRPFDQVIEMMARSNGLEASVSKDGFYYIDVLAPVESSNSSKGSKTARTAAAMDEDLILELDQNDPTRITVKAKNASIKSIIELAAHHLNEFYFMYDEPEGNTTLKVESVNFEELLSHLMNGSDYTFKRAEKYYLIGNRNTEGLRATELIRLENRTIETVIELIPSELMQGIEIKEFIELNGIVVSGSYLKIAELKSFIRSVDQVVPMVQIDIIIVFSEKTSGITKEMNAGIATEPVSTKGQVFPGVDVTLGSESINALINAFNGFGIINIGAVTPNFYASLRYLESNSVIDITSTPKISTLNGHEATFSVGETSYYQEERVNVESSIGGPIQVSNKVWKSTDANLDITVKPFVSADEYVTLQISVSQNDFQGRVDPTAPPNQTTQSFTSLIRVKNGEMILMGGLDRDSDSNAGSGTPYLSRIPVLKWFFSNRDQQKEKSKLHIFIKPTVTY